jgi:hypothetical protein
MNPTKGDIHVDRLLTNLSLSYGTEYTEAIAPQIFPVVPVSKQSDRYWKYERDDFLRTIAEKRAPATESVGGGWTYSTDSYFAEVFAVHKDIDDQTRANADDIINLDADATRWVTNQLLIRRDISWISRYWNAAVWDRSFTGVAAGPAAGQFLRWDDAGSDPISMLRAEITNMQEATGQRPNRLIMGARVWNALADHPSLLERIKYTERGVVGQDLLGSLVGIDRTVILNAVHNTAAQGADGIYRFMAGNHALLTYAAPNPGLQTISAGYTFAWTGLLGANAFAPRIKNFRMEHIASDRIEGEMAYDMKITAPDLGVFFTDAITA